MNANTLQRLMNGAKIRFIKMQTFGHPDNNPPAPVYRIDFGDKKGPIEVAVFNNCGTIWCHPINICGSIRASWAAQLIEKMLNP